MGNAYSRYPSGYSTLSTALPQTPFQIVKSAAEIFNKKMTDRPLILSLQKKQKRRSVMAHIVAGILSLVQYLKTLKDEPERCRLENCLHCGKSGVWFHGCYPRKADRSKATREALNPIYIQRFYCRDCRRTCSVLPECIPPRRWYLWDVQQLALLLFLAGKKIYAIAKEILPSRWTIGRWITRWKEKFLDHKDALCHHFVDLGRTPDFTDFWKSCLDKVSLASAMRLCHVSEVFIP